MNAEDYTDEQIQCSARDHASYGWSRSTWRCWSPAQLAGYDKEYYASRDRMLAGNPDPALGRTLWNIVSQVTGRGTS